MSSSPSGPYEICGKTTTTRCGPCLKAGTKDMFFCSAEHQKLFWSVHKKVCGDKSNPFTWPLLSKDKVKQVWELWDIVPHRKYDQEVSPPLGEYFKQTFGKDRQAFETLLEYLTEGRTGKHYPREFEQALLDEIRGRVGVTASGPARSLGTMDDVILALNVWQQGRGFFRVVCQTLDAPLPEPSASGLKQRTREMYNDYALDALEEQKRYLRDVVAKTHPEEARKVLWEHKLTYIPRNDKDLPPDMPSPQQDPALHGFKR